MATTGLGLERATRPDGRDSWPSSLNKAVKECRLAWRKSLALAVDKLLGNRSRAGRKDRSHKATMRMTDEKLLGAEDARLKSSCGNAEHCAGFLA